MITVVNTETLGISEYDLSWVSAAVFEGALYGLAPGWLEVLDPLADPPSGYLEWGQFSLPDADAGFAITACRVRGQAVGPMVFRTLGEEQGYAAERSYTMPDPGGIVGRDRQELLARDVDFTAAAFSLEGVGLQVGALRLAIERIQDWRR